MNSCDDASLPSIGTEIDCRSGVNITLEKAFREHYARLVSILTRLSGDKPRAEEFAAEAFWKLSSRPRLFRPGGNLAGWLYRTAMNLGLDVLRSDSRRRHKEQLAGASVIPGTKRAGALDEILAEEKRRHVRSVLSALKPAQAQLLLLRNTGMSYKELSEFLRLKPGSIGTLLARAEAQFEKKYRAWYGGET